MKEISIHFTGKLMQLLMRANSPVKPAHKPAKTSAAEAVQRTAFTGNFFAGPHSVFDPRLLDPKEEQ